MEIEGRPAVVGQRARGLQTGRPRFCRPRFCRPRWQTVIRLLWLLLASGGIGGPLGGDSAIAQTDRRLTAEDLRAVEARKVEQTAQQILEQQEFQYFERLQPEFAPMPGAASGGMPEFPGGAGGGRGGGAAGKADDAWPENPQQRRPHEAPKNDGPGRERDGDPPPGDRDQQDAGWFGGGGERDRAAERRERLFQDAERRQSRRRDAAETEVPVVQRPTAFGSAFGTLYTALAWTVIAAVCGAILFLIVRAIANMELAESQQSDSRPAVSLEGDLERHQAPGSVPADVYVQRARHLAGEGQYQQACAQLLLGAMSQIERSGRLHYRQGLTLRDYQRAVRGDETLYQAIRELIRIYEPLGFGRRPATRRHFELSLSGYEAGFHAPTPALGH